jgi:hypothetical protein
VIQKTLLLLFSVNNLDFQNIQAQQYGLYAKKEDPILQAAFLTSSLYPTIIRDNGRTLLTE